MLRRETWQIGGIRVPVKRRPTRGPARVERLAEDIPEHGRTTPILGRRDAKAGRLVLVEGYHRLEALRALGEMTVVGFLVQGRVH